MSKKSIIAKLLSEEDISVVHKKTKTAAFNVESRELILPIWKEEMSKDISDLFICHEIGHALYTSRDMLQKMTDRKIDKSYVNIIEDARIEKMVQDKYLGTRSCFTKGYNELLSKDFFGLKDKDLNDFNLADRINLHFKGVDNVPFSSVEQTWVDKVAKVKTEDEVLDLAQELMDFTDENEDSQGENQEQQSQSSVGSDEGEGDNADTQEDTSDDSSDDTQSSGSNDEGDEGEEEVQTQSSSSEDTDEEEKTEAGQDKSSGFQGGSEYKHSATTDLSFDKSLDDAMDKDCKDRVYATIPKVNDKIIIDYKSILEQCKKHYSVDNKYSESKFITATKSEVTKLQQDSKKVVSYMVKEFEMKKSADLYKRATVSKTGTLNMGALHTYQFNEDLFAKVTTMPGATNHGLVMFFDWSGSMQYNLTQTLKQLFNLVWFCDRVKIPYRVYAFSDSYGRMPSYSRVESDNNIVTQDVNQKSDLNVSGFRLLEMFSDKMKKTEQSDAMHYWYMMGEYYANYRNWRDGGYPMSPPSNLHLGGTPLNHAIVAAMSIIPKFKNDNGIQKVNAVFLTDGVSHNVHSKMSNEDFDSYAKDAYITDKVSNTTMCVKSLGYKREAQTTTLLKLLKKRIPDMNVIGFFVAGSGRRGIVRREIIQEKMGLSWDDTDTLKKYQKELRTNKVLVCKTAGYDEYYILPSVPKDDENDEDGIQVKENAKTGDLKRAFTKFAKSKTLNRQLLNKFIGQVA